MGKIIPSVSVSHVTYTGGGGGGDKKISLVKDGPGKERKKVALRGEKGPYNTRNRGDQTRTTTE